MNNQGEVTGEWGDGVHAFRLTVAGLIELEQKADAPFGVVFQRLIKGEFKIADVRETIRLGLIGAGKSPVDALVLTERYILPLAESLPIAKAIVAASMFGFEASPLGEAEAAPSENSSASTPPAPTATQTSLDYVLASWDKSVFGNTTPQ